MLNNGSAGYGNDREGLVIGNAEDTTTQLIVGTYTAVDGSAMSNHGIFKAETSPLATPTIPLSITEPLRSVLPMSAVILKTTAKPILKSSPSANTVRLTVTAAN